MCKKESFKGGIHLAPKDLRDYFYTEIAANSDANVAMRLMRHKSLATTTKYMRAVQERMRDAVENFGGDSMAANGRETSDLANLQNLNALAKVPTNHGFFEGKIGGGGRSRTYDARIGAARTGMKPAEIAAGFSSGGAILGAIEV